MSTSKNIPELLSVAETANLLGVTSQRVHELIKKAQILASKLGRNYYIGVAEVEKYTNQPRRTNDNINYQGTFPLQLMTTPPQVSMVGRLLSRLPSHIY
jgi:excisionase family DNA binding protein